jgi:uridine kinase
MTDIAEFLSNGRYGCVGVTGNAGAGKTSFTKSLDENNFIKYSIDWRFIGDSQYRKNLLDSKAKNSIFSYIDACNQFNWWDWDLILKDIFDIKNDGKFIIDAYNRDSGKYDQTEIINCLNKTIVVEGALLGPEAFVKQLDAIVFVYTPPKQRLNRLLAKDSDRRCVNEILARFLITEYSENIYYQQLFENYYEKMYFVDCDGAFISAPNDFISKSSYVPLPV